jgi:DNA-binding MarR family transcriptional regulator
MRRFGHRATLPTNSMHDSYFSVMVSVSVEDDLPAAPLFGDAIHGLLGGAIRRARGEMSLTALSTLSTLARTGPRRVTDLAAAEDITQPSMTKIVITLEQSGLIERRGDPTDKRVALVALTTAGANYLKTRRRIGTKAFIELLDELPDDEIATLLAAVPALEHLLALDDEKRDPTPSPPTAPATSLTATTPAS